MRASRKALYKMLRKAGQQVSPEFVANLSDAEVGNLCEQLWQAERDASEQARIAAQEHETASLLDSSQKHLAEAAQLMERASAELERARRVLGRAKVARRSPSFGRYSQQQALIEAMKSGIRRGIGRSRNRNLDWSDPDLAMEIPE
jgi:hypothetical protein